MKKKSLSRAAWDSFCSMFKRLFVPEKRSALEEEALQTPSKTVLKNFARNKLGIIGIIGFVLVMLFSFVGSALYPMTATYTELTNANLRPGLNYLNYPKSLESKNIVKISSGVSFSVALTDDGQLTIWGTECNLQQDNVSDYIMKIPDEIKEHKIVDIATGGQHVLALTDDHLVLGWGYYGSGQTEVPSAVSNKLEKGTLKVRQMLTATQWSAIIGDDGNLYLWGSSQAKMMFTVPKKAKGHIVQAAAGDNNIALLLDDGTVAVIGDKATEYKLNLPEELTDGSVKIVDVASTNRNVLALDDQGNLYQWGSAADDLNRIPTFDGKAVDIAAGYRHLIVRTDSGDVEVWGANQLHQCDMPENMGPIDRIYTDYFQIYGIDAEGHIHAWGNKGYVFGSDQYGRDILQRLIHGGRISLTVGAISVIISTVLAIIIGLASGYFGGWIDQILMRLADIVTSIPFLPLAITLSYAIGSRITQMNRMYLIMMIMGVLSWTGLARLIRAQLLLERERDFVLAAKAMGVKQRSIMVKHILPNVFNLVIVNITLGYASSLLSEAGLSFLGFGVVEPTPSWGNMLTSAQQSTVIQFYWWRWFIPALFVVLAALFANLIGDALREAMDPHANEK